MTTSRRDFFKLLGGAVAAGVVAPTAIIYKSRSVGFTTAFPATQLKTHPFVTPPEFVDEFLKLLRERMIVPKLMGEDWLNGQND